MKQLITLIAAGSLVAAAFAQQPSQPPTSLAATPLPGLLYTNEFFPGTTYRDSVPTPQSLLSFAIGDRAASAAEIERCLKAWVAAAPDRTRLVEYARTYENRPLHYLIVTVPAQMARLAEIEAGLAKLGDPRKCLEKEAEDLIARLPAVAWLAYTIHGDETEGSDAALAVLYHLIAAEDPAVEKLLTDVVVIVDPLMNPDGRDRFIKMIAEHRGAMPNVDDQSLLHEGYWPRGRGNHYLFDLNRDLIYGVHPETRGRLREIARWNPQLFVDAHGMGSSENHLFSPPREPINPNIPPGRKSWGEVFARDQAAAFDRHRLFYYTGEWHEEWYPGYTDGWASYRGAIGILYEQARVAEDGVRRAEGRILSYRESLYHHVIGSFANLATLQQNAKALRQYFHATRKAALDPKGPYADRTFAILPTGNRSRLCDLANLLILEGIELHRAAQDFTVPLAIDQLGRETKDRKIPAGTILIANRQPLGHLVATMLEFDPRLSPTALEEERKELLAKGESRIYDTTAWNLTMMFGLEALTLPMALPSAAEPYRPTDAPAPLLTGGTNAPIAYVIDGADDRAPAAAARLLERGLQVRVAEKPFRFDERSFARGSVVVALLDNRSFTGDLREAVVTSAQELELSAVAISSGLGPGDLPDLGGKHFKRLEPLRIALLTRGGVNPGDYGACWFVLDHHLGVRHSHVDDGGGMDLGRYNVMIIPDGRPGSLSTNLVANLKDWVKSGGTLIAIADAAEEFVAEKAQFSKVRLLPDVLGKLGDYELAVLREWLGRTVPLPGPEAIWSHRATPTLQYPWQAVDGEHPEEKELKKRDAWQRLFMPQGAIVASRIDTNHWLTFGCDEPLPILVGRDPILMAAEGVEAPIRYGYLTATNRPANPTDHAEASAASNSAGTDATVRSDSPKKEGDKKEKKEPPRVGWSALPPGTEMHLRMSGLLWPEATHRVANGAYVTREPFGRGQIILFATPPTFRGAARGTMRVFLNAVVCGPGYGAAQPVRP